MGGHKTEAELAYAKHRATWLERVRNGEISASMAAESLIEWDDLPEGVRQAWRNNHTPKEV